MALIQAYFSYKKHPVETVTFRMSERAVESVNFSSKERKVEQLLILTDDITSRTQVVLSD